ncbi:COG3713 Outer membrane protein V [Vibrio sp. B1ASS3]|uniref:MipA/OmpV family protein n=1 Tax=Vibrio sp. B1ASS3 TaxID=2751176 RepID=UPI001ABA318D|nr:MipA/OmpV family protein [Vibrio sp. B1ASS3]CAD7801955.1 COG3713 Outer membrane protein V [Vibrio sp. B1ASS3]CAE6891341.1 COG3713 Outer membrane protein V [Vibrio sp. B1ASS3]
MKSRIAFSLTLLLSSPLSLANDESFGIVGGSVTDGESVFSVKDTPQLGATPNLFYSGPIGFIDGSLANWQALPYVGISANWRFAEVSDTFADLPDGINDRDGNGELGITLGTVGARLTYLQDVTSEHNGYEVQLHLGRTLETWLPPFTLTPYLEVDYRDKKLSHHLYNVSAQEAAASGLNEFKADSTFVYQAGIIGLYEFTPSWIGISKAEFMHHDSDSPLIQRDVGWSFEVGLTYRFAGL